MKIKIKMFCLLLVLIFPAIMLCGCAETPKSENFTSEENTRFVFVKEYSFGDYDCFRILVDKETMVMYVYYVTDEGIREGLAGLSVLVNADGTPMIWEGEL